MFEFDFFNPETVWINVANLSLGVATLVCIGAIAWATVKEVVERAGARRTVASDDHYIVLPDLGLTMADGGEKLDDHAVDADSGEPEPRA